ncbi:hypothetical protein HWI79_2463 [Cryptosporidium felis]|nr:hypothetical protein HWI79_2463 [Cryptosporidium felis]
MSARKKVLVWGGWPFSGFWPPPWPPASGASTKTATEFPGRSFATGPSTATSTLRWAERSRTLWFSPPPFRFSSSWFTPTTPPAATGRSSLPTGRGGPRSSSRFGSSASSSASSTGPPSPSSSSSFSFPAPSERRTSCPCGRR